MLRTIGKGKKKNDEVTYKVLLFFYKIGLEVIISEKCHVLEISIIAWIWLGQLAA